MIKYVVKLGYNQFVFDNAEAALVFANTAKKSFAGKEYVRNDDDIDVTIELIKEETAPIEVEVVADATEGETE